MAIPDYQTLMLPVMKLAADGKEHKFSQAVGELADEFDLTAEERNELLPSGSQANFNNRVGWARSYLKQAGLLASPKRGFFTITPKGDELLATNPPRVDISVLEQYPEFIEFRNRKKDKNETEFQTGPSTSHESSLTPEDALASAYEKLCLALESEILSAVKEPDKVIDARHQDVISYFKAMSEDTGIPYQSLIDLYLRDCVSNHRKLNLTWA